MADPIHPPCESEHLTAEEEAALHLRLDTLDVSLVRIFDDLQEVTRLAEAKIAGRETLPGSSLTLPAPEART